MAAKSIHRQIISQHNERLFKREMNMAARIRHPNLIQFVGATLEGEMIILMELMPTSLRRELERDYMPPMVVSSISLDVSRALNYLHQMQPDPIIHRNISSANVLLEPITFNKWRAKVTDYGSVNLQQQWKLKVLATQHMLPPKLTTLDCSPRRWTSSALAFSSLRC